MKTKYLGQFILVFSLVFQFACTNPSASATEEGVADTNILKGQSGISDDLSAKNILQIAAASKDHTTLATAVGAAELQDVLVNAGPLTVFAPTNDAFAALPEGTVEDLLKPENKSTLARIIKFHASPGKYTVDMLKSGMNIYQASGHYLKIEKVGGDTKIAGAKILGTVEASNGIIHVIDQVLLPPQ